MLPALSIATIELIEGHLKAGRLSQRQIAVLIGVSRGVVNKVSTGQISSRRRKAQLAAQVERDDWPTADFEKVRRRAIEAMDLKLARKRAKLGIL